MGQRQREWAERWTEKLRELLGGKCAKCGRKRNLSFDVKIPVGDYHGRKKEWSWRISLYRREYDRDNLQLLCSGCNSSKKDTLILTSDPLPYFPF